MCPCAAAVMTTSTPADVVNLFGVFSVSLSGQEQCCCGKYPGDKPLFKGVCVRILEATHDVSVAALKSLILICVHDINLDFCLLYSTLTLCGVTRPKDFTVPNFAFELIIQSTDGFIHAFLPTLENSLVT